MSPLHLQHREALKLAYTIVIRFAQLLALILVGMGIANAPSFVELLNGLVHGRRWDFEQFAQRLAFFSSPIGLGVALIFGFEAFLRSLPTSDTRSLENPDEPWLSNPMRAKRRVRFSDRWTIVRDLEVFLVYTFVAWPLGLWLGVPSAPELVYTVLGVIGVAVLANLAADWVNRRWGTAELEILTVPGVIGGPFQGTVVIHQSIRDGTQIRVILTCRLETTYSTEDYDTGGGSHTVTETIWQAQKVLPKSALMDRPNAVAIPCYFAIPYSCRPTSSRGHKKRQDADEWIKWQLSVRLNDVNDLHQVTFDVPVFKTENSSPAYTEDVSIDAPFLAPVDVSALLKSIPFKRTSSRSAERLHFSLFRTGELLWFLAWALGLSLGIWASFRYLPLTAAFVAALIPGFLAYGVYGTLLQGLTWKSHIKITADKTTFTAGYLGLRRRYSFARGQRPIFDCHAGSHRETGSLYSVRLLPGLDRPCDIIKRLDCERNADALRNWLKMKLKEHEPAGRT